MAIFVWDSFWLLSQLVPNSRPLRLLKMMYNTRRSWDKQSESVNIRPKRMASTVTGLMNPRNCPGPLPTGRAASGGALAPDPAAPHWGLTRVPGLQSGLSPTFFLTLVQIRPLLFLELYFNIFNWSISDFKLEFSFWKTSDSDPTFPQHAGRTRQIWNWMSGGDVWFEIRRLRRLISEKIKKISVNQENRMRTKNFHGWSELASAWVWMRFVDQR